MFFIRLCSSHRATAASLSSIVRDIQSLAVSMGVRVTAGTEDSYEHSAAGRTALPFARPMLAPPKRILVLGAGFVSAPLVEYLLRRPANTLTVAAVVPHEAAALAHGRPRVTPVTLDVATQPAELALMVASHDIVVSLVPAPFHPLVINAAIASHRHVVTASYVCAEVAALHDAATAAGIAVLCEAGLDPGIDHMSAMRMIDAATAEGGTVTSFSSVCGGLPAPEAANNPLGYKFSWSPRGALAAARNAARFLRSGTEVRVASEHLLTSASRFRVSGNPAFALEVLPNRDAVPYATKYGIAGPHLAGMFRGTLRYEGFACHMGALAALGLLETAPAPAPASRADGAPPTMRDLLVTTVMPCLAGAAVPTDDDLLAAVMNRVNAVNRASGVAPVTDARPTRDFLQWLGLLDNTAVAPLRSGDRDNFATHVPLDTLTALLTGKPEMSYAQGQRDMALMQHELDVTFPATGRAERRTATLISYATKGATAMARTVGYTAAIATQLILDGGVRVRGIITPMQREVYEPILDALAGEGISLEERCEVLAPGGVATGMC